MKFIHVSDLHIGKTVNEFSMLEDQKVILDQIARGAAEEKADGIIIAGDVYDRAVPTAEAVSLMDSFLTKLSGQGAEVFLISGNHDSPERIGFAGSLLEKAGLHVAGGVGKEVKEIVREDAYGKIHIYLLPFATAKTMKHVLEKDEAKMDYNDCIKEFTERMAVDPRERNLLITHHFVIGNGEAPVLSDSENSLFVGGAEPVDGSLWKEFDYVALGHIHRPQKVGRETVRYAGSPLKYSFSEAYQEKSMTVVELKEKGRILIKELPFAPLHDMRILKGKLFDLTREDIVKMGDPEDYLQVTLTDTEELFEPMEQLRAVYPNVMQVILEKNRKRGAGIPMVSKKMAKKSTLELFGEFYEAVMEKRLDEKQREIARQIVEEIGGIE